MSFCLRLGPAAPPERIGGKARSLLRLAAAGLRVPPAVVVTSDLFTALRAGGPPLPATLAAPGALAALEAARRALVAAPFPAELSPLLAAELVSLDAGASPRFSVRSSAAIEDDPDALGAGLFLSRLDVPPEEIAEALRAVLASALAPGVLAYLARRGLALDGLGFAVLIHPFTPGDAAGLAALDASHGAPAIETHHGDASSARAQIAAALSRLTTLHGPVEIEWVAKGAEVTFLQLRPYRRARTRALPRELLGWRWDAAHNPLPLSPAQAGLVALVDGACDTGMRQKVVDGYLYYAHAPRAHPAPATEPEASAAEALATLEAQVNARLARRSFDSLEEALTAFIDIYQPLFGTIQPVARAAREELADFLRRHGVDAAARLPELLAGVPSAARTRAELARAFSRAPDPASQSAARAGYLDRFGDESPCWDVAEPTWRETPIRLERRLRALGGLKDPPADASHALADSIRATLPASEQAAWDRLLANARTAAAAAEDDDALYARAQAHVRNALLLEGVRLAARGVIGTADDVFWLPLELVRGLARGEATAAREETSRLANEARRADAQARAAPPSLAGAGLPGEAAGIVYGRTGAGGACIGRVRLWSHGDRSGPEATDADAEPRVIVARTILPTELPLISAAALVVETGGPLDHVAAQARERGIPAVVGAAGATTSFEDGDRVVVDGHAAVVARID